MPANLENAIQKYIGTNTERVNFTTTGLKVGAVFEETNTGLKYRWDGANWFIDLLPIKGLSKNTTASQTRPNNTTAYTAGDVVGTDAATNLTFANVSSVAGGSVIINRVTLRVDVNAVPAGMGAFRLHLYTEAPTAIVDNAAYNLPSGDRAKYIGYVDIDTPIDMGDTLYIDMKNVGLNCTLANASTTLYGILQTLGAYTPTAQAVKTITLDVLEV